MVGAVDGIDYVGLGRKGRLGVWARMGCGMVRQIGDRVVEQWRV